ncbi:hypothetical protein B0H14DRAFT_2821675, partial [Mycena olivaceomarginata]
MRARASPMPCDADTLDTTPARTPAPTRTAGRTGSAQRSRSSSPTLDIPFLLEYKCCGENLRRSTESKTWVGYTLALVFILLVSSERRNLRRLNPVILASDFFLRSPGARLCCIHIGLLIKRGVRYVHPHLHYVLDCATRFGEFPGFDSPRLNGQPILTCLFFLPSRIQILRWKLRSSIRRGSSCIRHP